MRHVAVVLGASLAVAACSADEFATPDGGGDGGVDAPVVVDSGADVRDSVAPPADAPADAPPKPWCLEASQISAEACADFDEGDIQSTFAKGVAKTIVCGGGSGGTAKLVSGGGGGRLELAGPSTAVLAPEASCQFKFVATTKNSWVIDFDVPALTPAAVTKPVTLANFILDANDPINCGFELQFIPGPSQQVQFQWAHASVVSVPTALTPLSHLQLKFDYNANTQEFAVTLKESGGLTQVLNYPPGCGAAPSRTTVFTPRYFSPISNGSTTILFDKITVTAN